MQPGIIQCCVTSPPYWPGRRLYNMLADGSIPLPTPDDIGFEPTLVEYHDHVVRRDFRELKRVMRPDGVVFVVLDDVIAGYASTYGEQHYERPKMRLPSQVNLRTQNTTYLRKKGNWLGLPFRFADAMMDDGWWWRDLIIWDKGSSGRKENTDNRCRHNFEYILMFALCPSDYWYDQDPLRIPLSGEPTAYTTPGRHNPSVLRKDGDRGFRVLSNPLGRVHDAVWHIPAGGEHGGTHTAPFPEELVRRCLLLGAPPCEMLPTATVIDIYGGSGPVSAVAKQLGLKSIYVDSNPVYAAEAQQRVLTTKRDPGVANDNQPTEEHDAVHEP